MRSIHEQLIRKLLRGECTPEELEHLEAHWQDRDSTAADEWLEKNWNSAQQEEDTEQVPSNRLWAGIQEKRTRKPSGMRVMHRRAQRFRWAAAASVALLLTLGVLWWVPFSGSSSPKWVTKVNNGQQPMELRLEDGSAVWLSRNSRLTYRKPFSENIRQARLEGEGYFEVAKDPERPFRVQAGALETSVLGTAFNLRAIKNGRTVRIALVEGRVEVRDTSRSSRPMRMEPGETVTFHRKEGLLEKERIGTRPDLWKEGIIQFQRADVHEVAERLGQWYDLDFEIEQDSLIEGKLVHRYDTRHLELEEVLEGISRVMDYTFERKTSNRLLIRPKN